ncbi:FKBP-type peptidyl-prolyl cis-trans isomerase [Dyella sp. C9]|uniref:FKBP-type peptidyl-prolyl cis-trans isomerase n=1 Tax=Dyella sp. C9 TaxID=2202154 RepID=UPI000DEFFA04|nr:FKBP-type peptidyl-prolyl cis-trans isomerase [Dyella sp. C9]
MKHFLRPTLTAAALAVALGMTAGVHAQAAKTAAPAAAPAAPAAVDKTKASYVVGWDLASSLPPLVREEIDPNVVSNALRDALSGKKPTMSEAEAKQVREAFVANLQAKAKAEYTQVAAKNKTEGDAFLAKNKAAPGVKTTASGLQYQVITQGTGARPGPSDTVQVNYVGSFVNGEVFDDSSKHEGGGPASIPLAGVIPGFREGMQLMQTGGHYKFFIPSNIAYGAQPQNGFPPNATIVFDVTLVKTGPTQGGDQQPGGAK